MKKFICILTALFLLTFSLAALAAQEEAYEISNYAIYITIQTDGSAEIREEIIFSSAMAYEGYDFSVDLTDSGKLRDINVWADGVLLEDNSYTVDYEEGKAIVHLLSPGENDWRTFACAYTMDDYAIRYSDTALLERSLISADHSVIYQNAAVILTMPRADGEILVYDFEEWAEMRIQYDKVFFGPADLPAGQAVSAQILFPEQWLDEAVTVDRAVRESIVSEKERQAEEQKIERDNVRIGKYVALVAYLVIFTALLLYEMKKYGIVGRVKGHPEKGLLARYPAAMIGYVLEEIADSDALTGTLAELERSQVIAITKTESGSIRLMLLKKDADLPNHQKAALNYIFSSGDTCDIAALKADDYETARRQEKAYNDSFVTNVLRDAEKANLKWKNENELIIISTLSIFIGLCLTIVMLMLKEMMIVEGAIASVGMFILMKQFNRVRHLTDDGEKLKQAALLLNGMNDYAPEELDAILPSVAAANALSKADKSDEVVLLAKLANALREAHVGNASMRRPRRKK